MILQNILNDFTWTDYGIQCPDAYTAKAVHSFLREAILDRHIYINKIVGFKIKAASVMRAHAGTYIARHKQLAESYPEILTMLLDKVFLDTFDTELSAVLSQGANNLNTVNFTDSNGKVVDVLYTNPDICRVIEKNCVLQVKSVYDCGYRDMRLNSKKIGSEYFPCYTDFTLAEYFKIPPLIPGSTLVPIRFYHGANKEQLRGILTKYLVTIQTGGLRKEEKEWLQNFMR